MITSWNTGKTPIGLLLLFLVLVLSPHVRAQVKDDGNKSSGTTDVATVAAGNNQFALELYQKLSAKDADKNVFVSPFSISTALAMTYAGGRNNTARQMESVLHFPAPQDKMHAAFAQLIQQTKSTPTSGYRLNIANALWGETGQHFEPAFLGLVGKYYKGGFKRQDFSVPDRSAKVINDWGEANTEGKIKDVVGPDDVPADTRLVLANAIYFKGEWAAKFDKAHTRTRPFSLNSGKAIDVQMMVQSVKFPVLDADDVQAVELSYAGAQLSMLVLLPKERIDTFEKSLTPARLQAIQKEMRPDKVDLFLPQFQFKSSYHLAGELSAMGMKDAFTNGEADFSGMTGNRDFYIGDVIHQAFIDVNEEGSEAAAVTVVSMLGKSVGAEPMVFNANHPFLFIIIHKPTNSILFMGRVSIPQPQKKAAQK
jgi:serine protease inhibitor